MKLTEYVARAMCRACGTDPDAQVISGPKLTGPKDSAVIYKAPCSAWRLLEHDADLAICAVRDWDASPELQA